ncbi:MAG TPA: hypothetical protein ENN19_02375 [Chloroflexi bacterium]|nr:hypothetical protein [Chloroflexota bacterium]
MTRLLQQLLDYALIFYIGCTIGVIFYVFRALAAQRERGLAMFTLERETATAQAARAWLMVVIFIVIAVIVFVSTTLVVPVLIGDLEEATEPTSTPVGGLVLPPGVTPTPSPTLGAVVVSPTPTPTPTPTPEPSPSPTSDEPIEAPTPEATDLPAALTGDVYARFGDVGELMGFSLSAADISTSQVLELTLYWRGINSDNQANYLVFTHLLSADGRLIGQHDGAPAGGSRPTSSWGAGETLVDVHPMSFYDTGYTGPARIAVGLYDPAGERLTTQTGEDAVVLPITINVTP